MIMVTSPSPEEGKSIIASNLAVVFAQSSMRVVLVDGDLRRPTQHQIFGLSNDRGLTTAVLDPTGDMVGLLQPSGVENLKVLTSGPQPPNPSELLGSKRLEEILSVLLREADLVIFDSPPVLVASDASVLSTRVDGTLLVCDAGQTRRAQASRAMQALTSVGTVLLGTVLNRADARANAYSYSYYYADPTNADAAPADQPWSCKTSSRGSGALRRPLRSKLTLAMSRGQPKPNPSPQRS